MESAFNCVGAIASIWLICLICKNKLRHDHRRMSLQALEEGLTMQYNNFIVNSPDNG